jgi:hypothetical protein
MARNTVQNFAHVNGDSGGGKISTEYRRAVGFGKNSFMHITADLALVDIKSGNDFNSDRWRLPGFCFGNSGFLESVS